MFQRIRAQIETLRIQVLQRLQSWWSYLTPVTQALLSHLWQALQNFNRHGGQRAAALAYYALFSIFPLTLFLAIVVGSILEPAVAQEQVGNALGLFLPDETVELLRSTVSGALRQAGQFGLVALAGLAWASLGLFTNLTSSLDAIFHATINRSMWRQRLLAFLMTLVLIMLIVISFVTSGALQLVSALFVSAPSLWLRIGSFFVPFGLTMVIFVLLFRYVPARKVYWDAVWPAAIFGSVGWELSKYGFQWYLSELANFTAVYGGIATVIVLLFWTYLLASILLLSAELCAELNDWVAAHIEDDPIHIYVDQASNTLPRRRG